MGSEDSMEGRRKESLKCIGKLWVVRQLHRTGVQMQNAIFYPQLTHQTSVLQLLVTFIFFSPACGARARKETCLHSSRAQVLFLHLAAGL